MKKGLVCFPCSIYSELKHKECSYLSLSLFLSLSPPPSPRSSCYISSNQNTLILFLCKLWLCACGSGGMAHCSHKFAVIDQFHAPAVYPLTVPYDAELQPGASVRHVPYTDCVSAQCYAVQLCCTRQHKGNFHSRIVTHQF